MLSDPLLILAMGAIFGMAIFTVSIAILARVPDKVRVLVANHPLIHLVVCILIAIACNFFAQIHK